MGKKIKKVGENNKIRNKIETKTVLNFDPSHVKCKIITIVQVCVGEKWHVQSAIPTDNFNTGTCIIINFKEAQYKI